MTTTPPPAGEIAPTAVPMPWPSLHTGTRLATSAYRQAQVADYGNARAAERDALWRAATPPVDAVPGEPVASEVLPAAWWDWTRNLHPARRNSASFEPDLDRGHTMGWNAALAETQELLKIEHARILDALAPPMASRAVVANSLPSAVFDKLQRLAIGGCDCNTKTPELRYHRENCTFRLASEITDLLCTSTASIAPAATAEPSRAPMTRIAGVNADVLTRAALANPVPPLPGRAGVASLVASEDTKRLDYLQRRGATVDLIEFSNGGESWKFRIGGLHRAVNEDIRIAIDAARASAGEAQS